MKIESVTDLSQKSNVVSNYRVDTVIKVVGVGGAGGNAVNCMIDTGLTGVEFIAINTDIQALESSMASVRIPLGAKLTHGRGAGGIPKIGEEAANEDLVSLQDCVSGADMVFVTAGMGGGTGSGAAPVVARVAKEMGILTVGVVTMPYSYEGSVRRQNAEEGVQKLRNNVDTLLLVPNDLLSQVSKAGTRMLEGFAIANDVLRQGVSGISDIVTKQGIVNIDFADVKTIMYGKGDALMGVGTGNGENRAVDAATAAINNPLLKDISIDGARNMLVNVTANSDIFQKEYDEIVKIITANSHADANRIIGYMVDEGAESEVRVTVVATEFTNLGIQEKDVESHASEQIHNTDKSESHVSIDEWDHMLHDSLRFEESIQPDLERHPSVPTTEWHKLQIPTFLRQKRKGKL